MNLAKGELPAEAKKRISPPPKGKSIIDLFADFILYLFNSTITHIKEAEPTGEVLWKNFGPTVEFVLAHPNGWEGRQQEVMRKAVVQAGIFSKEEALDRVSFVTEGEASFNYCATTTKSGESLEVSAPWQTTIDRFLIRRFPGRPQGLGYRCRRWNDRHEFLYRVCKIPVEGRGNLRSEVQVVSFET